MIVSAIDGRIRIVEPGLKSAARADAVKKRLQRVEGITSTSVNPKTGSLLIYYDTAVTPGSTVRKTVSKQLGEAGIKVSLYSLDRPPARRYVKFGLLGTITGSIGVLLLSSEEWHYRIGAAFLSLLSVHLFQNRRRIFK